MGSDDSHEQVVHMYYSSHTANRAVQGHAAQGNELPSIE
jgi:hypothetical protein